MESLIIELFTFLSLAATPITLIACLMVMYIFWKQLDDTIGRTARYWFIVGILVHFTGQFVDNLYWGIAWDQRFTGADSWKWWFDHGVISNLPFRQITTTAAAFCHVMGIYTLRDPLIKWVVIASILLTSLYVYRLSLYL